MRNHIGCALGARVQALIGGKPFYLWSCDDAAMYGRLKLLKLLEQFRVSHASSSSADLAVSKNQLHVLEYLWSKRILPSPGASSTAAAFGHLPIVKWLNNHEMHCSPRDALVAFRANRTNIVNYLWSQNIRFKFTSDLVFQLIVQNSISSLEWLEAHGVCVNKIKWIVPAIERAARTKNVKLLEWFAKRHIYCSVSFTRMVIMLHLEDDYPILHWMWTHKEYARTPAECCMYFVHAVTNSEVAVVDLFLNAGYTGDRMQLMMCIQDTTIADMLYAYNIPMEAGHFRLAVQDNNTPVIQWARDRGLI